MLQICMEAKEIMIESGNPNQWKEGYPSRAQIEEDIRRGYGYVCCEEGGEVVAYFAFMPGPDPAYAVIDGGSWVDDVTPYYVIHRMAKCKQGVGIFQTVVKYCSTVSANLRVDTHRDNVIMRHNLLKHGFTYCGIIYLSDGQERMAYQRIGLPCVDRSIVYT